MVIKSIKKAKVHMFKLCLSGVFMAINVILSMSIFSIPCGPAHLYLNNAIICLAAILLDPFYAFAVGGLGSFLGDLLFYPLPMFVSLITHGLQALAISLIFRFVLKKRPITSAIIANIVGCVIVVIGYTLGRTYVYSTFADALAKFPFEILQYVLGATLGMILCFKCGILKVYNKFISKY